MTSMIFIFQNLFLAGVVGLLGCGCDTLLPEMDRMAMERSTVKQTLLLLSSTMSIFN
jgi:hypothetical protein